MSPLEKKLKLEKMESNYRGKKQALCGESLFSFHREHLLIFLRRFSMLVAHYNTPSSSLMDNELFLVVEAVSSVTQYDIEQVEADNEITVPMARLKSYLVEFAVLKSGAIDLPTGIERCMRVLTDGAEGAERRRLGFRFPFSDK